MNYSTHAIDSLTPWVEALRLLPGIDHLSGQLILGCLKDSVKFLLPENGDVGVTVSSAEAMAFVRPVYPLIAFEYSVDPDLSLDPDGVYNGVLLKGKSVPLEKACKRISLVISGDEMLRREEVSPRFASAKIPDGFHVISLYYSPKVQQWVMVPMRVFVPYDSEFKLEEFPIGSGKMQPSYTVKPQCFLPSLVADTARSRGYSKEEMEKMMMLDSQYETSVALNALACINAKNVKTITVDAPAKLNAKRRKSGRAPFFEYKVLDIFLGEKVRRIQSGGDKRTRAALQTWLACSTRLHSVRGHFKVRKTGLFFWSSHLRGRSQFGTIDKEYVVKKGNFDEKAQDS